ncbi:MAG TPA: protein kinase, partial [Gemmatimonadaceae bacterium]|nr:protein kinase [Gemmatimonadaceae bacterium]
AVDRLAAALADRYRIERELGAGGMAKVYLAHDLKHDRDVAIKVLKPELAAVLGADRFVVEIRTTAALQHPHILPLFDSGEADGFLFYVMPFIDGETLRSRLDRETQLGVDESIRIATNVADALDHAHRHGVIHRDIKPENILLHEGRPMVADFGIALAVSAAAGGRMTETGLSLGTPHYMSPEQATAEKEIGARSDVYSLASVLYEMLAGQPPHTGGSAQQIIMKIITETPAPVTQYRRSVPPHVAAAVAKALEKLPADRFESAQAFAAALGDAAFTGFAGTPATVVGRMYAVTSRRPLYAAAAVGAVLLVVAATGWLRGMPELVTSRQRVMLWQHSVGHQLDPGIPRHSSQAAIAPDGSSIVYTDSAGGVPRLLRKQRNESGATVLEGTEGGVSPFFSPDGRWIGYRTVDGRIRKVPIEGGGSITLADDGDLTYVSAAWLDDGTIVYAGRRYELTRVDAAGGESRPVHVDTSRSGHTIMTISALPGSRGFLYTACSGNCAIESAIYVYDLAADSGRLVVANAAGAWYSPTGHLLYTDRAGGLYALGFDAERLVPTSGAVPVIDDVLPASFTLSASGTVLYAASYGGKALAELTWVSRDGSAVPLDSTWRGDFHYPALSPDGSAVAVSVGDGTTQLWIRRSDGTRQKLTQDGLVSWRPTWTPDGRSLVFSSLRTPGGTQDDFDLYRMPVDGSTPPALLLDHTYGVWEGEFSRDGRWLVIRSDELGAISQIRGRRMDTDTALVPLQVNENTKTQIALSPDGRWLAYASDGTGMREIYVAAFPSMTSPRLVSREGGSEPRWAPDSRELFYKNSDALMSVAIMPGEGVVAGSPRRLFSVAPYRSARNRQQYDVAPDGQHFVMIRDVATGAPEVVYVENWFPELLAKVRR